MKPSINTTLEADIFSDLDPRYTKRFLQYHRRYPEVYEKFKKYTLETINRKLNNFSARGIFHVMRWIEKDRIKLDGYKFNNNSIAYYSRMFERDYPAYKGYFDKRKSKNV